jgi:hypothetical protein
MRANRVKKRDSIEMAGAAPVKTAGLGPVELAPPAAWLGTTGAEPLEAPPAGDVGAAG